MVAAFASSDPFDTLFDVLPTGVMLLAPRFEQDELVDFTLEALNPAGQRALRLPAHPGVTLLEQFSHNQSLGIFARYQQAYLTGERLHLDIPYQADGLDSYYRIVVQRTGERLLMHFTDLTMLDANAARQALHETATQTRAVQQEGERQVLLRQILGQLPTALATLSGPEHRFTFVNDRYQGLVNHRAKLGTRVADVLPETAEQGFIDLLDRVYHTGQPYVGTEIAVLLAPPAGPPRQNYVTFTYQPLHNEQGVVEGILVSALDVTEPVLARKQRDTMQQALLQVAQRQAQQRQELLNVFTQAPVAVALLREPDHRLDYWNDLFNELFPGARLGATFADALPNLATAEALRELDSLYQGGGSFQGPVTRVPGGAADAPPRYVTFTYRSYLEQDKIVGVAIFAQEVTAQELAHQQATQLNQELEQRVQVRTQQVQAAQAEAERQRSELLRIFEQAPVAIAVYDGPTYTIKLANATVCQLWGRRQEDIIGLGLFEALPEVAGMGYEELLDEVMHTGQPVVIHSMEAQHDRNGHRETVYWDFVYVPMQEADGRITGAMVVANEVTEQVQGRRQIEQLNQELEARVAERTRQLVEQQVTMKRVLEQVPVAIAIMRGPSLVVTLANATVGTIWGRDPASVLGRPYFEAVPDTAGQGFEEILAGVLTTGQSFSVQEAPMQLARAHTGKQELAYLNLGFYPLYDEAGDTWGLMAVGTEVTDQVLARQRIETSEQQVQQLNEELQATNEELQATNEELYESNQQLTRTNVDLDSFVYAASHDLKAPIANIEGLLDALRDYLPPEGQEPMVARLLSMMQGAIARFQQTVGHLTDVSHLQSPTPTELVDLLAVLHDVRLDLQPLLESTHAELMLEVAECSCLRISAKSLRSVLFNLLSNAVKYRAPERSPRVYVRTQCLNKALMLEVQDNGLGLTEAQQRQLFTMFRRLHTHVEGSGVGLYLTRRTLENAGGTISVRSEPGIGSTFTVTIPRA